jgi:hypothetical protein
MIGHTWVGPDGATFTLTDTSGGVWLINEAIEGMGAPPMSAFVRQSAALDGQTLSGFRAKAREVFWPIAIDSDADSWQSLQAAFWASLPFGRTGVWSVTAPDGTVRYLACRFVSEDNTGYSNDPSVYGFEVRGINLVADDPFWRGPEVSKTFQTAEDSVPFFETGPTHVFNLMSSSTTASATVTNSGEVDSWPLWTVTGPATGFSLGVDGSFISGVVAVPDGQYLVINTDPSVQVARLHDGASSTVVPFSSFTSIVFARIPQGESVPLEIVLQGSGSVNISFEPGFRRAF